MKNKNTHFLLTTLVALVTCWQVNAATLVTNVQGYTLNEQGKLITFKQLLLDNGKVVSLDPKSVPSGTTKIDGHNKVMLPGLIDAHGHLMGLGANLLEVDLRETKPCRKPPSGLLNMPWVMPIRNGFKAEAGTRNSGAIAPFQQLRYWMLK